MREELGDVLMLALLIGEIADREGRFSLAETAGTVTEKLVRRHPHVFGPGGNAIDDADGVKRQWDDIKRAEGKEEPPDGLPALPPALPALAAAVKLVGAARKRGFDWPDRGGAMAKVSEEWAELRAAIALDDAEAMEAEAGDLLFAVSALCRALGTDPESALRGACARFRRRFGLVHRAAGPGTFDDFAALVRLWGEGRKRGAAW
jgi:MazG family protein